MECNNPEGCDCANKSFCKWFGKPKKKPVKGMKKGSAMKRTPLKKKSEKQAAELEIYKQLRIVFLKKNPKCQVQADKCTKTSTDVHHSKRRGIHINNVSTFVACCRTCHDTIERNPTWARENGWLL